MNCPVCGKEMERGWIYTKNGYGLYFLSYEQRFSFFSTAKNIEKGGGIALDIPNNFRFNETKIYAEACKSCRKIVIDY